MEKQYGADIEFAIIGERTGEMTNPDELVTSQFEIVITDLEDMKSAKI